MEEIALALGGGGVKGMAHLGVIHGLEQAGFKIRAIAGTSIGGLVGACHAAGLEMDDISQVLMRSYDNGKLFTRVSGEGPALMGLSRLAQLLIDLLGETRFEDLEIPFACTSVDLAGAQEVIFSQGRLVDAILATIAVPGVFPPKQMGDLTLIDGGVLDPVPVALARWLAPSLPVVAVVLSPVPEGWKHVPSLAKSVLPAAPPIPLPLLEQFSRMRLAQAFNIFVRSMDLTSMMLAELRLQIDRPEVIVRPDVEQVSMLDSVDPGAMIALGEKATAVALSELARSLTWHRKLRRRFSRPAPPGMILPIDFLEPENGAGKTP